MCAGPSVETTYWKANANAAQPVQRSFVATARLRGVTVCGLPVISTAWNATAIAWQPLQSCATARATFAEVTSSVPVGPAIMLERVTIVAAPASSTVEFELTKLLGPPAAAGKAPRPTSAVVAAKTAKKRRMPRRVPGPPEQERRCYHGCLRRRADQGPAPSGEAPREGREPHAHEREDRAPHADDPPPERER